MYNPSRLRTQLATAALKWANICPSALSQCLSWLVVTAVEHRQTQLLCLASCPETADLAACSPEPDVKSWSKQLCHNSCARPVATAATHQQLYDKSWPQLLCQDNLQPIPIQCYPLWEVKKKKNLRGLSLLQPGVPLLLLHFVRAAGRHLWLKDRLLFPLAGR